MVLSRFPCVLTLVRPGYISLAAGHCNWTPIRSENTKYRKCCRPPLRRRRRTPPVPLAPKAPHPPAPFLLLNSLLLNSLLLNSFLLNSFLPKSDPPSPLVLPHVVQNPNFEVQDNVKKLNPYLAVFLVWLMAAPLPMVFAASHREAPLTALDHAADITDFFAFVSYDDPSKVTFILCVDPFLEPANGPNYFPFDPNVQYSIKIDNNYDAVEDLTFNFQFTTQIQAPGLFTGFVGAGGGIGGVIPPAITSLTGSGAAGLSLKQTYTVNMVQGTGSTATTTNLTSSVTPIAVPSNVGPRTMPNYPALAKQGIFNLGNGITVFAGTVADPFYID